MNREPLSYKIMHCYTCATAHKKRLLLILDILYEKKTRNKHDILFDLLHFLNFAKLVTINYNDIDLNRQASYKLHLCPCNAHMSTYTM